MITLHTQDDKSAVLLSLEAFEYLVGLQKYHQHALIPTADFEQQFHQSLVDAGYGSREKIIDLVRDVKRELYEEAKANCAEPHPSIFAVVKTGMAG